MDPNATLKEILTAVKEFDDAADTESAFAAAGTALEAFENLDEWLSKGGFLPDRWKR